MISALCYFKPQLGLHPENSGKEVAVFGMSFFKEFL